MNFARLGIWLQTDPPGIIETTPRPDPYILVHVGSPVEIACERGGQSHRGVSVHGHIDIIPANIPTRWILKQEDRGLVIRVSQDLLVEAARNSGIDSRAAVLVNRFQVRDSAIEHLAWALQCEMNSKFAGGRLYTDCIGMALACRLLQRHSITAPGEPNVNGGAMPMFRLRRVLNYIEENLSQDLSLAAIAAVSGLSSSHCQRAFRNAVGVSIHQFVIQQRVHRAKQLLADSRFSIAEVALSVGFSHQSHLAHHMRRLLGLPPRVLRNTAARSALRIAKESGEELALKAVSKPSLKIASA
jgi:AraC family transcriptional regulator